MFQCFTQAVVASWRSLVGTNDKTSKARKFTYDLHKAIAARDDGEYALAVYYFKEALAYQPYNAWRNWDLAESLQAHKQYTDAIFYYNRVIALDKAKGLTVCAKNLIEDCKKVLYKELESKDNKTLAEEATGEYERAIEQSPNDPDLYFKLGKAQEADKQYDQAIVSYRKAIDLSPGSGIVESEFTRMNIDASLRIGKCFQLQGKLNNAIDTYTKLSDCDIACVEALYERGLCRLEQYEQSNSIYGTNYLAYAKWNFNHILELEPNHAEAKKVLEDIKKY